MGLYEDALDTINKIEDYEPAASLKEKIENKIDSLTPSTPVIGQFYNATDPYVEGDGVTAKVQWQQVEEADGYEYYCRQDDGANEPYIENELTYSLSYEVSASDPMTVFFKVRAYKLTPSGQKLFSPWSNEVSCTMNSEY